MMQSPTSINTYLQCPRKYYYKYIAKLPTKENANMLMGTITHKVLAEFVSHKDGDFSKTRLFKMLDEKWQRDKSGLLNEKHFEEVKGMLEKWHENIVRKANRNHLCEYLQGLKAEVKLKSEEYNVCGVVDLIDEKSGSIIEYKTSSKDEMKREYKLQIGIYALLFWEKFKRLPRKAIVHFLRHGEKETPVDDALVDETKRLCKLMKMKTMKKEIQFYPKKVGPLCKWCSGECDFYDVCFGKTN